MQPAMARRLPDGRAHFNHGPIDIIMDVAGEGREAALKRASYRFSSILEELVEDLIELRKPAAATGVFAGFVARRMHQAVIPFLPAFITPMAAVAGAVADEIVQHAADGPGIEKITVNNGGDIAFHLSANEQLSAAIAGIAPNRLSIRALDPWRGVATSGWRGRSQSLGIADSVSVFATNAARADAAATLIANAVDLPGHPAIQRKPASSLRVESDLGERLVTTGVGPLSWNEVDQALLHGLVFARQLIEGGLIGGAILSLNDEVRCASASDLQEPINARLSFAQNDDLHRRHLP